MPLIRKVNINKRQLKYEANSVSVNVIGDSGAVFSAIVTRSSDGRFYNFSTNTFNATTTSQSRLKNQLPKTFNISIPAATNGDTYTVVIFPEPHFETSLAFGANRLRHVETITQTAIGTITFSTDTLINAAGAAIGSATAIGDPSVGSVVDSFTAAGRPTVVMDDLQLTLPDANANHGVSITSPNPITGELNNGTWGSSALYWETGTYTANGAGSGATSLVLTSVDNLYIGMQLSYVLSAFQTELRSITAIDTDTLTVTLDGVETWSDTYSFFN